MFFEKVIVDFYGNISYDKDKVITVNKYMDKGDRRTH